MVPRGGPQTLNRDTLAAKTMVDNPDPLADPDAWAKTLARVFANPARTVTSVAHSAFGLRFKARQ